MAADQLITSALKEPGGITGNQSAKFDETCQDVSWGGDL